MYQDSRQEHKRRVSRRFLTLDQFTDGLQRPFARGVLLPIRHDDGDHLVETVGANRLQGVAHSVDQRSVSAGR
jgi:hypothetical protein